MTEIKDKNNNLSLKYLMQNNEVASRFAEMFLADTCFFMNTKTSLDIWITYCVNFFKKNLLIINNKG